MERIAEKYERQQLAGELATGAEIAAASPPIGDQGEGEAATPSRPTHADPHQAPPHAPMRTVTIQGQQFQVTEEQLLQLAEMGAMANVAMQQHAQSQAQQQHVPQPAPQRAPAGRVIDREQAAAIHNRLAYGGAEEGVAAVQDLADTLAARMAQEAVGVAQQTVHVAHQQQAQIAELNANLQQIGTEFPELFQHERLAQCAAIELTALRQRNALTGSRQSNLDLYREACRTVRQLFGTGSQEGGRGAAPHTQATMTVSNVSAKRRAILPPCRVPPGWDLRQRGLERIRDRGTNAARAVPIMSESNPEAQRLRWVADRIAWKRLKAARSKVDGAHRPLVAGTADFRLMPSLNDIPRAHEAAAAAPEPARRPSVLATSPPRSVPLVRR